MRVIIKPTICSIIGILIFSLIVFTILLGGANSSFSKVSASTDLTSILDDKEAVAVSNINNVKKSDEETNVNPSVFSVINLRFMDQIFLIDSADIQLMLGNSENLKGAKESLKSFGDAGIKSVVQKAFEGTDYDKKIYQANTHGIMRDEIKGFEFYENPYGPDYDDIVEDVKRVLDTRLKLNGGNQDYIKVQQIYHPGTNGTYSTDKYVELDHSTQTVYAWENGELYKEWSASGFYDQYAVFGVFDLKNKSKKAWSPIASKWMPYWMAFYFDKKQAAWFGIHELVYWYDADGNYFEESSDSIGKQKSGGCVRLDRGEMIDLYNWSEVGIHFLIYR